MGQPKATLPFGPETMLARVVRLLGSAVDPLVVVAAVGQQLPQLPEPVDVVYDRQEDRGPLEGLAAGLHALAGRAEAAFVTTCDAPLLHPAFVRRMVELSAGYCVAVPHIGRYDEPLAAVYRTDVLPQVESLLDADRRRIVYLYDLVATRRVAAEELCDVDPKLQSLENVNSIEDYEAALIKAGPFNNRA